MLGHGSRAIICWANGRKDSKFSFLNADTPPSKEQIDAYPFLVRGGDAIGQMRIVRTVIPLISFAVKSPQE